MMSITIAKGRCNKYTFCTHTKIEHMMDSLIAY